MSRGSLWVARHALMALCHPKQYTTAEGRQVQVTVKYKERAYKVARGSDNLLRVQSARKDGLETRADHMSMRICHLMPHEADVQWF